MLLYEMLFKDAASIIPCLYCTHTKTHLSASFLFRSPTFPLTIQQISTPICKGPPKALHQKSPHVSLSCSGDMSPSNSVHQSISMVVVSMLKKSSTLMSTRLGHSRSLGCLHVPTGNSVPMRHFKLSESET